MSVDPANSCALFITVHSHNGASKRPALSAKFQFEDHIRCVAARQCLHRNRENLKLAKMTRIAKMLHLPAPEHSATHSTSDLSHSAIHRALQDTFLPENSSSQLIEMSSLQAKSVTGHTSSSPNPLIEDKATSTPTAAACTDGTEEREACASNTS